MQETIVISLGGSLIIPDTIDIEFLKEFKALILSHVAKGKKFAIIIGGGKIARIYQDAAKTLSKADNDDLDWIGIASLRLNAELLRVAFEENACAQVVNDLAENFVFDKPIVIGAAHAPGRSSDYDATLAAKTLGAKKMINLSNTNYVYDSDPKKNPNAKKIEQISWQEYRKLIPAEWTSGLNTPFDPIASKMAEEEGISVMIMNGKPIDNLADYLNGVKFQGTIIS
jgi:uridylate kinase